MYKEAKYASVPLEVSDELRASLECALAAGVRRESVMLDPGLGFAKRPEHSYAALAALPELAALGCPLVAGPSRKSFLNAAIGDRSPGWARHGDGGVGRRCGAARRAYRARAQRAGDGRCRAGR